MHGVGIRRGVHRHRGDPQLLAGPLHAQGNFPAIGNQNFFKHPARSWISCVPSLPKGRAAYSMTISTSPNSTGWASWTRICFTVPLFGAGIGFMVFIASTISSVSPWLTFAPS